MNGYRSPLYAESLAEFGAPLHLPQSDGWLLGRPIPESAEHDAVGCYPLFDCGNWQALGADLDDLRSKAIAVSLVVDPFAQVDGALLGQLFSEVCRPYKQHAVVEFAGAWRNAICAHHRRNIRTAARHVEVERCADPATWLETWNELYANLIARHQIEGIAQFSRTCFRQQLAVPGIVAFRAFVKTQTVGMLLWYADDTVAYYHLGAFSPLGYEARAAFALFDVALNEFAARGMRWASLGAGAGWRASSNDGLMRFKSGWAKKSRTAWFCGRILAPAKYEQLAAARNLIDNEYFPKYRVAA
jgi:GNAT acetyltransferase-like protein